MAKKHNTKQMIRTILLVCLGLFIVYWFTLGAEQRKIAEENRKVIDKMVLENIRQAGLNKCYDNANATYMYNWNKECNSRGLRDDCKLPNAIANAQEDARISERINCQNLWK